MGHPVGNSLVYFVVLINVEEIHNSPFPKGFRSILICRLTVAYNTIAC